MAIKSSNTQGNPYHDEGTGEFTSANGSGQAQSKKPTFKFTFKEGFDLKSALAGAKEDKKKEQTTGAIGKLADLAQVRNIPMLRSARDIEDNIEKFFSNIVTDKIVSLYGKSNDCSSFQFHPRNNPNMILEIFPNVLGKYRYKDNYAKIVAPNDFQKLLNSRQYTQIYRGISSTGEKARGIVNNYGTLDLNNFDYYCPSQGNCYGSCVYTTISYSYAQSYANYGRGTMIEGLLEPNASYMRYSQLSNIRSSINFQNVEDKIRNHLVSKGQDSEISRRIARSFRKALEVDNGLVAVLLGLDYFIADDSHQRNLLNLNKWIIRGN